MSAEILLWGIAPTAVALFAAVFSVVCATRSKQAIQILACSVALSSSAYALLLLKRIFADAALPVFVPHVLIAFSALVAVYQWRTHRRRTKNAS